MAQDVKIISNVGYYKGNNGQGMLYAAKTAGGTYLFAMLHLEAGEETWRYYRRSQIENGYAGGDVVLQSDLNMSIFTDAASPDFLLDGEDGLFPKIATVTNGDDLPRLYNLESAYTVKGDGIITADIDKLKVAGASSPAPATTTSTTTTTGSTGALGGLIPSDFSTLFSNPLKFIQDNMMFVILVLAVIYFVRRKKKKPLWLF